MVSRSGRRAGVTGAGKLGPARGAVVALALAATVALTPVALLGQADADSTRPARLDTVVNFYGDTIPTLTGLTVVDIDSLLLSGEGILIAFEDTIPFAEGTLDTLLVGAQRVTIDEVVRRIGERMEAERFAIREHEFTGLTKVVARAHDDGENDYTIYEGATRIRRAPDGTYRWATLWEREREYEKGELKKEKVEDEIEVDWAGVGNDVATAVPFSLESGDQYNYEILDRRLVGMNLVYKMRFEPKDSFAALASGTVWVDYSDWVIRRIEAEITGAVPVPLVIKSIPVYKLRRVPKGEHWVLHDAYARVELRKLPLADIPGTIEVHWRSTGHIINGVEYPDAEAE